MCKVILGSTATHCFIGPFIKNCVIFKSTLAKRKYSFRGKNLGRVDQLVKKVSKKYGVNIHKYANSGNHLHMIISCKNRYRLKRWIQILPQSLMFLVTELNKSTTLQKLIGRKYFFDYRPFTRIIQGWRNFIYCRNYVEKNILKVEGCPVQPSWIRSG